MDIPLNIISVCVSRGDILHGEFAGINHSKFFVVMGVSDDSVCGYFYINSNIHPKIMGKDNLLAMQYPIKRRDYDFLKYDSFVCASQVFEIRLSVVSAGIAERRISIISRLKDEHIEDILDMVNNSDVIPPRYKKRYFQ